MNSVKELRPYQLVILDCPYDTWDSQETRELFVKVVGLKLKGYLMSYPYGTLPVDTNDFVGTHHLICEKLDGQWVPVMGYKSITLSRCKQHQLTISPVGISSSRRRDGAFRRGKENFGSSS